MRIPLLALLFQGIPEQIAVVTLAFVIAKLPIRWREIIIIGVLCAVIAYTLRLLPITFGVHTIILIGMLFVILIHYYKRPISTSLIASLFSFFVLIVFETTFLTLIQSIFDLSIDQIVTNLPIRVLSTLPQIFLIFFLALVLNKIQMKRGQNDKSFANK